MHFMRMRNLIACGVALAALGTVPVHAQTLDPTNGHYYEFVNQGVTWDQAAALSSSMLFSGDHGHLATISDADENAFITGITENQFAWIGFHDPTDTGNFVWIDGEPVTYTNWAPGEPNNIGTEDVTVFNAFFPGGWNNFVRSANFGFVVEFEPGQQSQVPEPAPGLVLGIGCAAIAALVVLRRRKTVRA